jgi:protein involved in polysaccharide export with SLBB domain
VRRALPRALLLCLALSACRTPPPLPPPGVLEEAEALATQDIPRPGSTLGPGDVVEVRVYQEPEYSGSWRLSAEGTIDYPLCGKVQLSGLTSSQAADALVACLRAGLRRPEVAVLIRENNSKKVFLLGQVQRPGSLPYDEGMTVVQAIAAAGGFTPLAARNDTQVTRKDEGRDRRIRVPVDEIQQGLREDFPLKPGDLVFVPERLF